MVNPNVDTYVARSTGAPDNADGRSRFAAASRIAVVVLAATWMAGASLAAAQAQRPPSASGDTGRVRPPEPLMEDESEPLAQELAGARREVELLQHLSQEHERAERLEKELVAARRDLEAQAGLVGKAKDEAAQIRKASEGAAEALAADLTKARTELYANQAQAAKVADEVVELRRQLATASPARQPASGEKERIAGLERDLATARRDLETQTGMVAKARDEATQSKKASEGGNADLKQAVLKEHERAEALAGDLAKVRVDFQTNQVQATKSADEVADLRRQLAAAVATARQPTPAEKERVARLERDLDTQVALAAKSREEAEQARAASEREAGSLREQVRLERSRVEALERDLAAAKVRKDAPPKVAVAPAVQEVPKETLKEAAKETAKETPKTVAPAPDPPPPVKPTAEMVAASAGLVARASSLLRQGDIAAARTVLERAAEMGNAQANFALAETYDPSTLAKWGTYGTRGDAGKARDLYAKAGAGGIKEAKERADALRR